MGIMKIEMMVEIEFMPEGFPACVQEVMEKLGFKVLGSRCTGHDSKDAKIVAHEGDIFGQGTAHTEEFEPNEEGLQKAINSLGRVKNE